MSFSSVQPHSLIPFTLSGLKPKECRPSGVRRLAQKERTRIQCPLPSALHGSCSTLPGRQWHASMILAVFYHGLIFWHGPSPSLSWAGHVASTPPFQLCQACSWPTPLMPPPVPSPLSSANKAALLPFSIPASWCVSPRTRRAGLPW